MATRKSSRPCGSPWHKSSAPVHPPERIENDVAQGRLRLHWADAVVVLDHAALREACRCAECQFKRHHG
ncbi:gamma-butyrobetaine hydroxylase-like domain-containing protein, partial [Escherichia coli]|uniref:gamma-butyrobetaine hydroxylase-like domain-containing protein n=2 Tax=Pseudomonadota TaxID=1224 RepID=UPI001BDD3DBA